MAALFSAAMTLYLRFIEPANSIHAAVEQPFRDIFSVLTYRDKYETERKYADEVLRESEERFRTLAKIASDMICRMSLPDGRYEYVSPASAVIFGYSPEEFYDSPVLIEKIIHPDWRRYFTDEWENLVSGRMPSFYEYQIIHKSGEVKWMHQRNVLVKNNLGQNIAIEGVVTDITERKKADEEKEVINRELLTINRLIAAITVVSDLNIILQKVLDEALDITGLEGGTI